jgi:hypothetical protein
MDKFLDTVGDLRRAIADVPDDMPLAGEYTTWGRVTAGSTCVLGDDGPVFYVQSVHFKPHDLDQVARLQNPLIVTLSEQVWAREKP